MINLIHGDCIDVYPTIDRDSIDLILCDPPYGTVKGIGKNTNHGMNNKTLWDMAIDPQNIFDLANHCLRKNGKIILFSQEPYTSRLIQSSFENIDFCYRMVWKKDHFANALIAKTAPVSYYEDVLVFKRKMVKYDYDGVHPLRLYFEKVLTYINKSKSQINKILNHTKADHCFRIKSTQFSLCTQEVYEELITVFNIDQMDDFMDFQILFEINKKQFDLFDFEKSTFNLPKGAKYKSNILEYSKDYDGYHPTQKPVKLLEDLIQTYSNEGDKILDFTMGSGSTGVACLNQNRDFIGIEKDPKYFEIAKDRLERHQLQLQLPW